MGKSLTIIQLNDTHSYLEPHPEYFWKGNTAEYRTAGGFSRIAGMINRIRKENEGSVMTFDCGDTFHGTCPAVATRGEVMVPILNSIGFDAMTAHWEFAYGPERFKELAGQLSYPILAINCYHEASDELVFEPYRINEIGGLRVGVIGIAATIVDKVMPSEFSKGIYFSLGNAELPRYIDKLRNQEKVDLIVVISHLGFPQEAKLAREVEGIDVLLSGHTHNRMFKPALINDTIIIQSGCHGSFLGKLDVEVENKGVTGYHHELIAVDKSVEPDPQVGELVDEALAPYRGELSRVAGQTLTPLDRSLVLESSMDNLLLDSLIEETGVEMAFSNGWRYGAPIPPGPVTLNDLYNIIPVNPPVSTCVLSGEELWAMMEENLERTFSRDPYKQMGGYVKRCAGINVYAKLENPKGERIQKLFAGNREVKADKTYQAAFVTTQGVPAKYGSSRKDLKTDAITALRKYLEKKSPVSIGLRGSIRAI
ncbi:bifunctional metallophosphatase/5'-nucleotidase [candidate division WOR-3 bacterium]|uniref:Bifunctional metallophosphatase/5'-nucleotidase n=1 Tax=candidate division WOR-3 bacterium TaxID=2052148 RepID=A0A9D5QDJ7_UNCW3|nr:bifunctional metallophosphatase/5'-nucleotidase [candidate division WOR-3 bacterium]MBD3365126.1 bifunctional metallophosphatase/5'-nucleotidase [candidate division WOR-3 bacterium]